MVNGASKCAEEAENIISICPKWAIEELREKKKQLQKIEALQTAQYRSALEVSPYNKVYFRSNERAEVRKTSPIRPGQTGTETRCVQTPCGRMNATPTSTKRRSTRRRRAWQPEKSMNRE